MHQAIVCFFIFFITFTTMLTYFSFYNIKLFMCKLIGLEGLECLTELDLSYNCLTEHSILWPLKKMSTLLWVSLEGNPLSHHPKHRILSLKHLHPSLSDSKVLQIL